MFYLETHKLIGEAIEFIHPKFHIDLHTFEVESDSSFEKVQVFSNNPGLLHSTMLEYFEINDLQSHTDLFLPNLVHLQPNPFISDS